MATKKRVAIVTGGNKGIGLAIVRGLCKQFDGDVYLTARNEELGKGAVEQMKQEGLTANFFRLDIRNEGHIEDLKAHLMDKYGGLDVLINNAAIAYKRASTVPFPTQAKDTIETNFTATLRICEILFPILRPNARVVHISSRVGVMAFNKTSDKIKNCFKNVATTDDLKTLINDFLKSAEEGTHTEKGWPAMAYGVSKLGVCCLTGIQQREMDNDDRQGILINSMCPGFVNTDMSSHKGFLTPDEGADTALYCALLPEKTEVPKGNFVVAREVNPDVLTIKHALEDYKELLLPLSRVLEWEKPYHSLSLVSSITFVFALIWYAQPSFLTTIALLGILFTCIDFMGPIVLSFFFKNERWSSEKDESYEQICQRIANAKRHLQIFFTCIQQMKKKNPTVYLCVTLVICCVVAWIGNLIDNLFLTYLIVLIGALVPGLRKHGMLQKFTGFCASQVASILEKARNRKKKQ
ncbi:DgyrCDS12060 [Dimorphilus gyrociliatus]|uniref:carbonyl reductase (NADPH) n=1 Tax=Dimorphilus gyrociliatus TaxID=2664684 RepID=A0A7I8W6K5_9ANNE|nr:DgyrCDS12060 [Dimorphilus gyrociliatus]